MPDETLERDECDVLAHVDVAALIATALLYNHVSLSDGFHEFDVDKDGLISVQDLVLTARSLNLFDQQNYPMSVTDVLKWHSSVNISNSGRLDLDEWRWAMEGADPEIFEIVDEMEAPSPTAAATDVTIDEDMLEIIALSFDPGVATHCPRHSSNTSQVLVDV